MRAINWRSVFINAAAENACRHRILIKPFSTLSRIFLYSERVGGGGVFLFIPVQGCFSFPNPPCCDCTQTDNKSQMSYELKAAEERGREELMHFLWLRAAFCIGDSSRKCTSCTSFLSIGADGNLIANAPHQWVRRAEQRQIPPTSYSSASSVCFGWFYIIAHHHQWCWASFGGGVQAKVVQGSWKVTLWLLIFSLADHHSASWPWIISIITVKT